MAKLEYSTEALNILGKFHSVDTMLFVEGNEDILFWEFLFEKFATFQVKVQSVGGKPKLNEYAQQIISGELNVLVAMDSDYSLFSEHVVHPNIVRTFGYSIENSLITPEIIKKAIRTLSKIPSRYINDQEISEWLSQFIKKIELLFIYDLENDIQGHGCPVAGNNCSKFMTSQKSSSVCGKKVGNLINSLTFSLSEQQVNNIFIKWQNVNRESKDVIRGHFIFSAVYKYVVEFVKRHCSKISVSIDAMLSTFVLSFEQLFDERHSHHDYYKKVIAKIETIA